MITRLAFVGAFALLLTFDAQAQTYTLSSPSPEIGVRVGYDFEDNAVVAGAQAHISVLQAIKFIPSFDAIFGDDFHWQLNGDVGYDLNFVYLGGGLAVAGRDFNNDGDPETRVGFNVMGGLDLGAFFQPGGLRPFVEVRWSSLGDVAPLRAYLGVNFPLVPRI
jgi:hypothetical protein